MRPMSYRHAAERDVEPTPAAPKRCRVWHRWELVQVSYPITARRCIDCGEPRVTYSSDRLFDQRVALDSPHITSAMLKLLTGAQGQR